MWVVFIDDSATSDPPRVGLGELVALGAVFVPEQSLKTYGQSLAAIRTSLDLPDSEEFKWKPNKGSALDRLNGEQVAWMRRAMLEAAANLGIRSAVVVWSRGHLDWAKPRILPEVLKYLYERIEMCLADNAQVAIVIADVPGGGKAENDKWLDSSLPLTTEGTQYVRSERVVLPILTAPSHHVPHLQLADLVTAATTAAIAGRKSGLDLAELLARLAHRNAYDRIGGAGVVLWPPELSNLFHWVWDEDEYLRKGRRVRLPSGGAGDGPFSQPGPLWSYADSDGIIPAGSAPGPK